jgi:hypothetical protein
VTVDPIFIPSLSRDLGIANFRVTRFFDKLRMTDRCPDGEAQGEFN